MTDRSQPRLIARQPSLFRPDISLSRSVIEDFCHAFERGSKLTDPAEVKLRKVVLALGNFMERATDNEWDFATSLPQLLAGMGLAGPNPRCATSSAVR